MILPEWKFVGDSLFLVQSHEFRGGPKSGLLTQASENGNYQRDTRNRREGGGVSHLNRTTCQ